MTGRHGWLSNDVWNTIRTSVPIVCVDVVLLFRNEVGLIERVAPFPRPNDKVWCHVGGRVNYGETLGEAAGRHIRDATTWGGTLPHDLPVHTVMQWFPISRGAPFGVDPTKHAVSMVHVLALPDRVDIRPGGEALSIGWFPVGVFPEPLWPGTRDLVVRALAGHQSR
jgi:ADP-ribose pyrophosphatase YjhB (NUDIX family)